jgi:hypothetical protein
LLDCEFQRFHDLSHKYNIWCELNHKDTRYGIFI